MTKLSWIRGAVILLLLLSFQATAENDGVVSLIADELDISLTKAKGGAGAIFAYVKDNLDEDDFADIAEAVPDMDSILDAAPEVDRDSRLGRASDRLRDFDSSMGGGAGLAASFDALNMDPEMVTEFLPIIYDYVESHAGEREVDLLEDAIRK
jgi:Protein of unknown function VcgC/VcgE (DUF2780)